MTTPPRTLGPSSVSSMFPYSTANWHTIHSLYLAMCFPRSLRLHHPHPPCTQIARWTYFVSSVSFSVEYLAKLLAAKSLVRYLLLDWAVVDVLSIVFGFLYFDMTEDQAMGSAGFGFIRVLRGWRACAGGRGGAKC